MKSVALTEIRTDGGTQMRAGVNSEVVEDYRDKWKSGTKFEPIDLFYDGVTYWLADGFHRFYGAREAKRKEIPATIHNGTVRDAKLFACGANDKHGLRRTNADKRIAVEALLTDDEWKSWSDRKVAETAGVSHWLVGETRKQLAESSSCHNGQDAPGATTGRDGRRRRRRAQVPHVTEEEAEQADEADSFEPDKIESQVNRTVDIRGLSSPYKQAVLDINRIVNTFEALASEERTGVHLADKFTRIKHDLNEAKQAISQAEPIQPCGSCDGKGCKTCYQSGFWTRAICGSRRK